MTDEDIIKALEYCNKPVRESKCTECAFNHTYKCTHNMLNATLDLINRQQAEIERLNEKITTKDESNYYFMGQLRTAREELQTAKHEAVKEFAERLKNFKIKPDYPWDDYIVTESAIDNLVKELTEGGANNG